MHIHSLLLPLFMAGAASVAVDAAIPANYYTTCNGKKGAALLEELHEVIGDHTTVSYNGLWDLYCESDVDANGKIWDMYSTKRWTPGDEQCGTYSTIGDCYNREHSFPKSWFNNASPMASDAFHIYPTDGKVNGQRSNFPYGECANGTSVASSGGIKALGKLGASTFPGYSGTVFEPDDEYKGDFARSYFYMAACYNDRIDDWDSPMLAGNSYPAFSQWAVNLLLKWHREDPVSQKEINRNEVIYNHQHNRNPFIDHPELAEHVWGNKTTEGWNPAGSAEAVLSRPAEGMTIDFGTISAGVNRYYDAYIEGSNFTEPLTVTVTGNIFSTSTTTISASAVNSGTTLRLTALSSTPGTATGTLKLANSSVSRTVELKATIVNGLPALTAGEVTENSFVARWVNIDVDDVTYYVHVKQNGNYLPGYPKAVAGSDEQLEVTGLEAETTYTYYISNHSLVSNTVTVTTASPDRSLQLYFDGELKFITTVDVPSAPKSIDVEAINISDDLEVKVSAPFEVSIDKNNWSTTTMLEPGEDRFYLRIYGEGTGTYATLVRITAGEYVYDDWEATGTIRSAEGLCETFESGQWKNTYNDGPYEGVEGTWDLENAGVYESDSSMAYEGSGCARLGKKATSVIAMGWDTENGLGTLSFMGKPWMNDADVTLVAEYSLDGGNTWTEAETFTLPRSSDYTIYSTGINQNDKGRVRLRQTAGSRALLDNLKLTAAFSGTGITLSGDNQAWDAYSHNGELVIESAEANEFAVYATDASLMFSGVVKDSIHLSLPTGLYVVVSGETSRRVVVK